MADTRALDIKVSMDQGQLDADIRTSQRLISAFTAEVRKSDAEVKAFGKSSENLASKKDALTKKLEAQNKKMELLTASYEKQKSSSSDTSVQTLKLEKDMNLLSGQISKTEGDLNKVSAELSDYTDGSGKAGDSTVALYGKIEESSQQLKTNETELKKASSEVKVFGENSETLGNKLVALNTVYDSQKSKMELLQTAYDREVEKSGAASTSAQTLAQEMNKLETAMNNTQVEIDETTTSLENVRAVTPDTADNIDKLTESIQAMIMDKVLDYLDSVADKILQIGANAVTTAADIQAHDALFGQVFGNMQDGAGGTVDALDTAYERVDELAEYSGRIPTSLEEGFIKMGQQFMSMGTESEEALDLTTRSMKAATDAAAAYNIPIEDAQGNLQSFIQGNNRAGQAVGVIARETQLAAFAVEKGYIDVSKQQEQFVIDSQIKVGKAQQNYDKVLANSKSTPIDIADAQNKLTKAIEEQEEGLQVSQKEWTNLDGAIKQAVRVDYIENMYGLSQVTGQANREAEEYETTLANWEESQRQLNKVIGEAALELLIPIMRDLTDVIMAVTTWFKNLSPELKTFFTYVAVAIVAVMKILVALGKFKVLAGIMGTTMKILGGKIFAVVAPIVAIIAVIALVVYAIMNSETAMAWLKNAWQTTVDFLTNVWNVMKDTALSVWQSITEWVDKYSEEIKMVIDKTWGVIKTVFTITLNAILKIWQGVWFAISTTVMSALNVIWQIIVTVFNTIKGVIEVFLLAVSGDWAGAWTALKQLFVDVLMGIWNIVVSVFNWIYTLIVGVLVAIGGFVIAALQALKAGWDAVWGAIGETVTRVWIAMGEWIATTATNIATTVSGWLTTMGNNFTANWEYIKTTTAQAWEDLKTRVSEGAQRMYETVVEWIGNLKTWWNDAWAGIKTFFSDTWKEVGDILKGVKGPIDSVIGYFNGLWSSAKSVFTNIKNKISETWDSVKDTLGKLNPANWGGAYAVVRVTHDDDPYNPAVGGFDMGTGSVPIFSSAIGSLMAASRSAMGGINSAFNNLNGIYESGTTIVNMPQDKSEQKNLRMEERMDRIEELLTLIAQKELHAFMDSREVTSRLYNPMQNEVQMRDIETSRLNGSW